MSVGPNQHGGGSSDRAQHRQLPPTRILRVDSSNPICPGGRRAVEGVGLTEIEQDRSGLVQQGEEPPRAAFGDEVIAPLG